jgi:hypothetical protein
MSRKLIRPKILGTLSIKTMVAGNYAVVSDIKNSTNRICIPCRSIEHGEEIIEKLKETKAGEMIYMGGY